MLHLTRLFAVAIIATFAANTAPPFGTWKMNPQKSHYVPGPSPLKSFALRFEPAENGEYRVTATGESSDGKPIHTSYVLREDGKDYPVANAPFDSIAVTRIDANTSIVIAKRHGKVIGKTSVVVAGNTMTETTEGVDLTGKAFHAVEVLEKQ